MQKASWSVSGNEQCHWSVASILAYLTTVRRSHSSSNRRNGWPKEAPLRGIDPTLCEPLAEERADYAIRTKLVHEVQIFDQSLLMV